MINRMKRKERKDKASHCLKMETTSLVSMLQNFFPLSFSDTSAIFCLKNLVTERKFFNKFQVSLRHQ
jgi:hypothetical protein